MGVRNRGVWDGFGGEEGGENKAGLRLYERIEKIQYNSTLEEIYASFTRLTYNNRICKFVAGEVTFQRIDMPNLG
jgi:hypothetical protein